MYEQWPYLCVFLALTAAGMGMPIPEDIPLLTGGYLCHVGIASLPVMIGVAFIGVLSGDILLFTLGRRFGHRIVEHRFVRKLINPRRLLMAEELFAKHGVKIVFIGRFLPGLRAMIFTAAGVLRVKPAVFLAVNGSAACISVPTLVILGNVFGGSLDQIRRDVRIATHTIAAVAIIAMLIGAGIYLHRRQKRLLATTHEPPAINREDLAKLPPRAAEPDPDAQVEALRPNPTPDSSGD